MRWQLLFVLLIGLIVAAFGYQLLAVRGAFAPSRSVSEVGGKVVIEGAQGHRLVGRAFVSGTPNPAAPMVLILHGDAPFANPRYQYIFASKLADEVRGTRVVALLRPGYADPYGAKSDGDRGFATADNYTAGAVHDIAAAIRLLQLRWQAPTVILVGHSGGAAIAADIAALDPGLVQQVFLVGCPCDVTAFRRHMAHSQWSPMWLLPVRSISPLQILDRMQKGTVVTAISGNDDSIALPQYAKNYIAKATTRGIMARMIEIPGGHEILDDARVIDEVAKTIRSNDPADSSGRNIE